MNLSLISLIYQDARNILVLLSTNCLVNFSVVGLFADTLTLCLLWDWCHTLDHIYVFLDLMITLVDRRIVDYVFSIFILIIRRWSKSLSCPRLIVQLVLLNGRFDILYILLLLFLRDFLDGMLLYKVLLSKLVEEVRMPCLLILCLIFLLVVNKTKLTLHGRWIFVFGGFCRSRIWVDLSATIFWTRRKPHHLLMILECEVMAVDLWRLLSILARILLRGTLNLILRWE